MRGKIYVECAVSWRAWRNPVSAVRYDPVGGKWHRRRPSGSGMAKILLLGGCPRRPAVAGGRVRRWPCTAGLIWKSSERCGRDDNVSNWWRRCRGVFASNLHLVPTHEKADFGEVNLASSLVDTRTHLSSSSKHFWSKTFLKKTTKTVEDAFVTFYSSASNHINFFTSRVNLQEFLLKSNLTLRLLLFIKRLPYWKSLLIFTTWVTHERVATAWDTERPPRRSASERYLF